MCGLYGVAGYGAIEKDRKVFRDMMLASAVRGEDSTGVYWRKKIDRIGQIDKRSEASSYCAWKWGTAQDNMFNSPSRVMLGHVRDATVGKVNDENAHPFRVDDLIGAHNGTLWEKEFRDKSMTDSEMMFRAMKKNGIAPTLKDIGWGSAYAVSIYDETNDYLYLSRNELRPLHFAVSHERDVMYWASEFGMLRWILDRNKINYGETIFELSKDTLGVIPLAGIKSKEEPLLEVIDVECVNSYWSFSPDSSSLMTHETNITPMKPVTCFSCHEVLTEEEIIHAFSWEYEKNDKAYICKSCEDTFSLDRSKMG